MRAGRKQAEAAMRAVNSVFGGLGTTIFTTMSALAVEHRAINLGQGFPEDDGPEVPHVVGLAHMGLDRHDIAGPKVVEPA